MSSSVSSYKPGGYKMVDLAIIISGTYLNSIKGQRIDQVKITGMNFVSRDNWNFQGVVSYTSVTILFWIRTS